MSSIKFRCAHLYLTFVIYRCAHLNFLLAENRCGHLYLALAFSCMVWYNDLSPWERGAALPALGPVWPLVGLAPLPPLAASPPSMVAQAGKLEEAGSWKAATLVAAGSMRKLKLQPAVRAEQNLDVRI